MFKRLTWVTAHTIFIALAPVALLVMTGCPSLSTMQTPSTVPRGELRYGVGFEGVGYSEANSGGGTSSVSLPQLEVNARYGVTDDIDIGAKAYLIGAEVGGKYQFAKGTFEAAVAPAVSYISVSSSSNGSSDNFSLAYLHLPVLLGYKLTSWLELAFGPKALYAIATGTAADSTNQSSATSAGFMAGGFASIQLRVGEAFWIAPEVNVYKPFADGTNGLLWQGGLTLLFGGGGPPAASGPP